MKQSTRNLLGVLALAAAWTFLLDDETRRGALTGDSPRTVIDAEIAGTNRQNHGRPAGKVVVANRPGAV